MGNGTQDRPGHGNGGRGPAISADPSAVVGLPLFRKAVEPGHGNWTWTGVWRSVVVPSPRRPESLYPQHQVEPSERTAQV